MRIIKIWERILIKLGQRKYVFKNIASNAVTSKRITVYNPQNLIMEERTNISADSVIMNTRAKFIIKKWSGAAFGLTVITGNHMSLVGQSVKDVSNKVKDNEDTNNELDRDVIVDEDVWIGARVILLSGVHIGRGAEIGAGTIVRTSVPPYAIVIGNPAKIVGFRFTPEEVIEHEKALYLEKERLPLALLEKNYEKYFINRVKEIKEIIRL